LARSPLGRLLSSTEPPRPLFVTRRLQLTEPPGLRSQALLHSQHRRLEARCVVTLEALGTIPGQGDRCRVAKRGLQESCGKLAPRGVFELRNFTCKSRQNKELTSGLEPLSCSLGVIIQALQGNAEDCKSRISKPVSFLCFAQRCTVLRSRWCQSGIRSRLWSLLLSTRVLLSGCASGRVLVAIGCAPQA
jgi:hypothetical protein